MIGVGGCVLRRIVGPQDLIEFVFSAGSPLSVRSTEDLQPDPKREEARVRELPSPPMLLRSILPDGKQVALVVAQENRKALWTAQVALVDPDTGSIHQSRTIDRDKLKSDLERIFPHGQPRLGWSPEGDQLLISPVYSRGRRIDIPPPALLSYELSTSKLTPLPDLAATLQDRLLNRSIAGEGTGSLVYSLQDLRETRNGKTSATDVLPNSVQRVVYLEWTGHKHDLNFDAATLAALNKDLTAEGNELDGCWNSFFESTLQGSWDGPVAVLRLARGVARIDCAQFSLTYQHDASASEECDRRKRERCLTSRRIGDVVVEVIDIGPMVKNDAWEAIAGPKRIDIRGPAWPGARTLVGNASWVSLALAPDDRKLAIRYAPGTDLERILVIDEHGKAVADLVIGDEEKAVAEGVAERATTKPTLEETPGPKTRNHLAPDRAQGAEVDQRADAPRNKAAAGRYARALAADPWLRDDLEAVDRYLAACDDLQTGCGGGAPAEESQRARLRRRALDSLKANLDLRKRELGSGTAENRVKVQQNLKFWKVDRGLAGVRDPDALAKLPDDEQMAWRALWADVNALAKMAQGAGR